MTEVGMYEARTNFSKLARRVKAGEEITVTDRGTPVMKMIPARKVSQDEARAIVESWRNDPIKWDGPPLTIEEIIAMKHEGHKY